MFIDNPSQLTSYQKISDHLDLNTEKAFHNGKVYKSQGIYEVPEQDENIKKSHQTLGWFLTIISLGFAQLNEKVRAWTHGKKIDVVYLKEPDNPFAKKTDTVASKIKPKDLNIPPPKAEIAKAPSLYKSSNIKTSSAKLSVTNEEIAKAEADLKKEAPVFDHKLSPKEIEHLSQYIDTHLATWQRDLEKEGVIKVEKNKEHLPRSLHVYKDSNNEVHVYILLKKKGGLKPIGKGSQKTVKFGLKFEKNPPWPVFANYNVSKAEVELMKKLAGSRGIVQAFPYALKRQGGDFAVMQHFYNGGDLFGVVDSERRRERGYLKSSHEKRQEFSQEILNAFKGQNPNEAAQKEFGDLLAQFIELDRTIKNGHDLQIYKRILSDKINAKISNLPNAAKFSEYIQTISKELVSDQEKRVIFEDLLNGIINLKKLGILNRDIKPYNVFLDRDKEGVIIGASIGDFGMSNDDDYFNFEYISPELDKAHDAYNYMDADSNIDYDRRAKAIKANLWTNEGYQVGMTLRELFEQRLAHQVKKYPEPPPNTMDHLVWEMLRPDIKDRLTPENALAKLQSIPR